MKAYYKILAFLLIVSLFLTMQPDITFAATAKIKASKNVSESDPELVRAVALGIGTNAKNVTITYKQFFQMLDVTVKLANPKVLDKWKKLLPDARKSNKKMLREEGMLAVFYAAKTLGSDYYASNWAYWKVSDMIGDSDWKLLSYHYPLFPDWNKPVRFDDWDSDNYIHPAYAYSIGRASSYNDKSIFDYDSMSAHPTDPFTYEDALRAALRLYESKPRVSDRIPTKEDAVILHNADVRREAILESKTDVKITGTAYYVSNKGDDNNDGLSPQTAWATIDKVNRQSFNAGDGLFFERGGVYRGILCASPHMTYSAYGEGPKPKIMGSPENGADPSKWTLLDGTKNIWMFYKELYDTGGIVFNEGESWAIRKSAFWNGSKYVEVIDKKTPINIKKINNLQFYNPIDYTGYSSTEAMLELEKMGKIYLRCDKGNPGEIYDSIEFLSKPYENSNHEPTFILKLATNCLYDNLSFMYCQGGVTIGENSTVQNCEVSWVGGAITAFVSDNVNKATVRAGDGILCALGTNNKVLNNYVHHTYDNGINIETGVWQKDDERYEKDILI